MARLLAPLIQPWQGRYGRKGGAAQKKLGIEPFKTGLNDGWQWSLPKTARPPGYNRLNMR
jgi:hypothetical protein